MDSSWKFVIGFVLLFVVVFGTTYISIQLDKNEQAQYTYNGFEFVQAPSGTDVLWVTQIEVKGQPYNIPFYHHPSATESVAYKEGLAEAIVDTPTPPEMVYISLSPDAGSRPVIAAVEISRLLGTRYNLLNMQVQSALSKPDDALDTLVRTCEDARDGVLVIVFEQGEINAITNEGNCITMTYTSPEDSILVADRFAYELLKIM